MARRSIESYLALRLLGFDVTASTIKHGCTPTSLPAQGVDVRAVLGPLRAPELRWQVSQAQMEVVSSLDSLRL